MSDIILKCDGKAFVGWKYIHLVCTMQAIAYSFCVEMDLNKDNAPYFNQIKTHSSIELIGIDNETKVKQVLLTGYIDKIKRIISPEESSVQIQGRSKTRDLIDCVITKSFAQNQSLTAVAKSICNDFSIEVTSDNTSVLEDKLCFSLQTPFYILNELAKNQNKVLLTNNKGNLLIQDKVSKEVLPTPLIEGENIILAEMEENGSNQFSSYKVKIEEQASIEEQDENVPCFRPYEILSAIQESKEVSKQIALFEKRKRAYFKIKVVILGWEYSQGKFWQENKLCEVNLPSLFTNSKTLLIESVTFNLIHFEKTTVLTLVKPETYHV